LPWEGESEFDEGKSKCDAVCMPVGTGVVDLIQAGQKFVQDNPRLLDVLAASVLVEAFAYAYPCKSKKL
jgi:Rap1a immunity proteins